MALRGREPEQQEDVSFPLAEVVNECKDLTMSGTPLRYRPLCRLYSSTSPNVGPSRSSNIMTKKVKAKKMLLPDRLDNPEEMMQASSPPKKSPVVFVYSRRNRAPLFPPCERQESFYSSLIRRLESQKLVLAVSKLAQDPEFNKDAIDGDNDPVLQPNSMEEVSRRSESNSKLYDLSLEPGGSPILKGSLSRGTRIQVLHGSAPKKPRLNGDFQADDKRRWIELNFDGVDSTMLLGLQCKVYWPLDDRWYTGRILRYKEDTKLHQVKYTDGDTENLILANEKIKFLVCRQEIQNRKLNISANSTEDIMVDCNEMAALAAIMENGEEPVPGDIVWAKITGHAVWPAIVLHESPASDDEANKISRGRCIHVQFFGTHDFARVNSKNIMPFLRGLISSFHLKCKKPEFHEGLKEAKRYLNEQKLPRKMMRLQRGSDVDDCESAISDEAKNTDLNKCFQRDHSMPKELRGNDHLPFEIDGLKVINLGRRIKDPENLKRGSFIWPEGYTALREFLSVEDPNKMSIYRMEVLKTDLGDPLFRVTSDNGQQFEGHSPSSCWNKIYGDIRKILDACPNVAIGLEERLRMSGLDMFGLSNSEILYLIQGSSKTDTRLSDSKKMQEKVQGLPLGYRPVHVEWNDLDKCSVCHMDEEYMNNLFLQCDKCRIMVHSRCYGELDPFDELWLCNLCRPGAPHSSPSCCLCPVIGGAMKPTTDGRWAHLACAIWIPETCFFDIKRMEPIDGINRISKDRWRLLCTLCGVTYGACIQCSNNACRVSYHPLCARAAGFCMEMIDEDRLHLLSIDDEMDTMEQCISLLSFCKKHKQRSTEPPVVDRKHCQVVRHCSKYSPPSNESGCARCEPYNHFGRRGRKEPEALAAASMKRLFVENQPYLVGGYSGEKFYGKVPMNGGPIRVSPSLEKTNGVEGDTCKTILSAVEKYVEMKNTFRRRLAFGKSGIHGFGIFAKAPHKAGDMVIEYTGELVRPSVADRRERLIYNSLVGAGTYMFRIDDERVIDATRAGSIAHLINHSCEPNCYSRALTVNGDDHIIIFAKRDIKQWEELTYDYRFFSIDEHLPCYCGFPRCRGVVNDIESERMVELQVPQSALKPAL